MESFGDTNITPPRSNISLISNSSRSRYENQKRRDWNTFGQYLTNHRPPPLSLPRCSGPHVVEFLKYLDQFGKTKVHNHMCPLFGQSDPPASCPCPLRQAWGSLDALVGRLRAAFEENGGKPEANPFGAEAVMLYLREVRVSQAKARGISYDKKKRRKPAPQSPPPPPPPSSAKMHLKSLLEEAPDQKLSIPCRPIPLESPAINQTTAPPYSEDIDLVEASDASIQSALQVRPPLSDPLQIQETNALSSSGTSTDSEYFSQHETSHGGDSHSGTEFHNISIIQTSTTSNSIQSSRTSSGPPVSVDCLDDRSVESTLVQEGESSSCVICMDAAVEGAFIPCGHMAGCMACLNDIKIKNWNCPVCRAKVDQVLRLYAV